MDKEERRRGGRVVAQRSVKNFAIGLSKEAWVKGGGATTRGEWTQEFWELIFQSSLDGRGLKSDAAP